MIIDKALQYWTDKDSERLKEIDEKQRLLYSSLEFPLDEKTAEVLRELSDKKTALEKEVEARYIKDKTKKAILSDVKEIVEAITKEDFKAHLSDFLVDLAIIAPMAKQDGIVTSLEELAKENYDNCFRFISSILRVQFNALADDRKNTAKVNDIIEKRVSLWYVNEKKDFSTIRQGTSTNALTKLRATEGRGLTIDPITGDATIKNGNFILTIPNYEQLTGLETSTYRLLDAITISLTESGAKSPTVVLPLSEYMKRRGIKDRKTAKAQVISDMEILKKASFSWIEKKGKKTESYSFVNIADSGEVRRNGDIIFTFGATFYKILLGYKIMPYPSQLQTLNSKRNPNSYYLLRKIAEHKNMNIGKKNENIIAVKTLLNATPFLPTVKEVMETDKALTRRIIEPFERDMDALGDTLKWNYCHSLNIPLTDDELSIMNYHDFEKLYICTEWNKYPDQTERLERKAERAEQAKEEKQKQSKKKNQASK